MRRFCERGIHYTAELDFGDFTAVSEKQKSKSNAEALLRCAGKPVVKSVRTKEKSEKAPALYDLTSLQRDANRILHRFFRHLNLGADTSFPAKALGPGLEREKYIFAALVVPKSRLEPLS